MKDGLFSSLDKAITHEFAMLPQYTQKLVIIDGEVDLMNRALDSIKQKNLTKATVIKCSKDAVKTYKVEPNHTSFFLQGTADSVSHEYEFNRPMTKDIAIQLTMLETLVNYLKVKPRYDFSNLKLAPGRNSYFDGKNGLKIIDSSYNAHLISVKSILEMYKAMHVPHKWLVIGDIVDQGSIEGQEHAKLADEIIKVKPEQVILIGRRTKKYTAPILKEAGLNIYTTLDPREALKFLEQNLTGQETLLFKGSQYLEWLIEKLLKNPEEAKYLPRREKAAIKRRQKRGLN